MDIKEAIKARHMVRKYTDKTIPADLVEMLNARITENNEKYGMNIKLVTGKSDGLSAVAKLVLARGVNNYIALSGKDTPELDEKAGYCGADVMLYAQTLGLNTWWVGGMYSRKGVSNNTDGERPAGIIAIGYGQTQGIQHKMKTPSDISSYEGDEPQWFKDGVEALLLAPTALNKMAFTVKGTGNKVSLSCENGIFSGVDKGIGKYFFEAGAGKENFEWV